MKPTLLALVLTSVLLVDVYATDNLEEYFVETPQVTSTVTFANMTLQLDAYARGEIQKKVNSLTRSDYYFQHFLERCELYFPLIDQILEEKGVPNDFKYLALHESTLKGDATSKTGAKGYWQFKDFTAVELGMRVDGKIDERQHIISSTKGAATYLKKNYETLNNWMYALVAYNKGLGGAKKTVGIGNKNTHTMKLNKNTPYYVFYCVANKIAFEKAVKSSNTSHTSLLEYEEAQGKSLHELSKITGIPYSEIETHNLWLHTKTVPSDKAYSVLIPCPTGEESHIAQKLNIKKHPTKEIAKRKESSSHKNHPKEKEVVSKNTQVEKKTPTKTASEDSYTKQLQKFPVVAHQKKVQIGRSSIVIASVNGIPAYIAKKDQSPVDIAKMLHISYRKLLKLNDIKLTDGLRSGEIYYLKPKHSSAEVSKHIVASGETIRSISQKYGIKISSIQEKNRLGSREPLKVGRVLLLQDKLGKEEKPTFQNNTISHVKADKKEVGQIKDLADRVFDTPQKKKKEVNKKDISRKKTVVDVSSSSPIKTDKKDATYIDPSLKSNERFHIVKKGESFYQIARLHGCDVNALIQLNTGVNPSQLSIGQILILCKKNSDLGKNSIIPEVVNQPKEVIEVAFTEDQAEELPFVQEKRRPVHPASPEIESSIAIEEEPFVPVEKVTSRKIKTHVVREGETLMSISFDHDIEVKDLKELNNLIEDFHIEAGTVLKLEKGAITQAELEKRFTSYVQKAKNAQYYTVQKGDTMYTISKKFNLKTIDLMRLNDKTNTSLSIGERLLLK